MSRKHDMKTILFIFTLLLIGCANPVSKYNAVSYEQAARNSTRAGDWHGARIKWARAVRHGFTAGQDTNRAAIRWYEYGRALGVTCFYKKSDEALIKAYELITENPKDLSGWQLPEYWPLIELARLNLDNSNHLEASSYFSKVIPLLLKSGILKKMPYDSLLILDEYTLALNKVGNVEKAKKITEQAKKIRTENPKGNPIADRTPYGTQCIEKN